MKKHKLLALQQLIAFLLVIAGICIIVMLTAMAMNKAINLWQFFGWLGIVGTTMYIDACWIDRLSEGGEWI